MIKLAEEGSGWLGTDGKLQHFIIRRDVRETVNAEEKIMWLSLVGIFLIFRLSLSTPSKKYLLRLQGVPEKGFIF